MNKKFVKILTAASAATMLGACAVQQPCPVVETAPAVPATTEAQAQATAPATNASNTASGPVAQTEAIVAQATVAQSSSSQASVQNSSSEIIASSSDNASAKTTISAASSSSAAQPAVQQTVPQQKSQQSEEQPSLIADPVDPYTAIPSIVDEVFDFANTLFQANAVDEAVAYLQKFRIMKPLWNEWQIRADSLLNVFGQTNAERAKQYEPMVLEIRNMNRVNAAYSLVAAAADSLIALAPGDSLTNFANEQKRIAYKNTLAKGLKEKTQILELAEAKARFEEALKQATEFQMRYRDFENELQIEKMIAYIQRLQNSINSEDQKYWEKNDPEKALAEVDGLIEKKSYDKAKILVDRLRASKLRQQAAEKYQKLADAVCTDKRKTASQLYSQATKQKKPEKKKELLLKAIGALNNCSDEYPEYEKIKTVTDNIIFLKKELDR